MLISPKTFYCAKNQQSRWMWTEITHTRCLPLSQENDAFDFAHLFHDASAYYIPATTVSARWSRTNTCSMSPTSVHACKLRTLLRKIAMNTLHISAWKETKKHSQLKWKHIGTIKNLEWAKNGRFKSYRVSSFQLLMHEWAWERFSENQPQRNGRSSESLSHFPKDFSLNARNWAASSLFLLNNRFDLDRRWWFAKHLVDVNVHLSNGYIKIGTTDRKGN